MDFIFDKGSDKEIVADSLQPNKISSKLKYNLITYNLLWIKML